MRFKPLLVLCVFALTFSAPAFIPAQNLSEHDILSQANARIQKYRTGEADLRLVTAEGAPLKKGTRVRIEQVRHSFLFGSNLFMLNHCKTPAGEAAYEEAFSDLFNFATIPFYWWMYERQPGSPNYADTDRFIEWCRTHHITMKGHPLAWNNGQPRWLPTDPSEAMRLQMQRITDIVGHFKGKIDMWDVVNEATDFARDSTRQGGPTLTAAIRQMGVRDYLHEAFVRARQANPQATLVINDYVTRVDYLTKVISQLKDDSGTPLNDIVGIQCHQHRGAWSAEETWQICERFAASGEPLHFTEATILSGQQGYELKKGNPKFNWANTREGERRQEKEVVQFYTILFSHPSVQAITWWDLSDQGAWQGAPAGLIRADMTPKPAYKALMKLIKGKWWTRTSARVSRDGTAHFHGFYGEYKVTVEDHGRRLTGTLSFDAKTSMPVQVNLN